MEELEKLTFQELCRIRDLVAKENQGLADKLNKSIDMLVKQKALTCAIIAL